MLPILYQNHDLILYSYPLLMGIGWGIAYQVFFSLITISRYKAQLLFWGAFLFAWIGAKLLFVLTSANDSSLITNSNFWMGGGFVFYGGLIGGFLFVTLFKLADKSFRVSDLWPVLPALTLGHATGRIGCFLAGCCYGKPTESFWGVFMHGHYRHPTQLIEAAGLFCIGLIILKSRRSKFDLLSFYLIGYGVLRYVIELLRDDVIRGNWEGLTPSQWISVFLIFAGILVKTLVKPKC